MELYKLVVPLEVKCSVTLIKRWEIGKIKLEYKTPSLLESTKNRSTQ